MAYILTHGGCYDGFTAAWAIRKGLAQERQRYGFEEIADKYFEVSYGQPVPEIPDGEEVIIADFSYPEPILREIAERAHFLTLLDHHKTAQEALSVFAATKPDNCLVTFDMAKSGAMLAWQEFVSEKDISLFVRYIQDRDLWTKALPYHEEVTAYIHSYERDFDNWDYLHAAINEGNLEAVVTQGTAILRYKRERVKEIGKHHRIQSVGGYDNIPVVNAPYNFSSDVCDWLLDEHPTAKFSAYYFDRNDGLQQWGLRSRKDFDCSVVAKMFGGGGHAQACGFQLNPSGARVARV